MISSDREGKEEGGRGGEKDDLVAFSLRFSPLKIKGKKGGEENESAHLRGRSTSLYV